MCIRFLIMEKHNLLDNLPEKFNDEFIEEILNEGAFSVERIISTGQSSPEDFWYDQLRNEFVLLIQGYAEIEYYDGSIVKLHPGDYLIIPKHKKHRVNATDSKAKTVWLTIFFE